MLIRIGALILSLAAFCACASVPQGDTDSQKAQLHQSIGISLFEKQAYPQALREMLEAARLDPNDPLIQNNLGLVYLARNKHDAAEKAFLKAIELKPSFTDARNNLGRLYIDTGLYDKAIKELNRAAADLTYDQPEKTFANLGHAFFLKGDYALAKESFQRSLKERRDSCLTMNYYGRTLFELKNYKEASESLDQAVVLCEKSKFDEPRFYSGLSFYKLNQRDQARARFNEVLTLYPDSRYAQKAKEMLEILK